MTDRYAVIGNPIAHSKSPRIHMLFAQATGQDLRYEAIEAPLEGFAATVAAFRAAGGRGVNVTAPFKLQACELATTRLPRAQLAGAANALKFEGDSITADNFDGLGLVADIERNLGVPLAGTRLLVLGAGGAVRGTLLSLLECRPERIVVANRTAGRAEELAKLFAPYGSITGCGLAALADQRFDVVINATSAGISGAELPLPEGLFAGARLAYEMIYGKGLTAFLRQARQGGTAKLADGIGMLVEQAAEAFAWWRDVRPDTVELIRQMSTPLE